MIILLSLLIIYIFCITFFGIRYDKKHKNNSQSNITIRSGYGSIDKNGHIPNGFGI